METLEQCEVRSLIEKINRECTSKGDLIGTRFELLMSNCLEILCSQLYEKSAHFLPELIQNADDNIYDCPRPTLSFSYKPGSLRIDCNEVGFKTENVEAICSICRSTKSGKTSDGEFIGEKGIGLSPCSSRQILCGYYSTTSPSNFDKTKFLGMGAPVWEEFPEPKKGGCTSIFLQLSEVYEGETLIQEFQTFDVNLLAFLRRIEGINIRITRPDTEVWEKKMWKIENQQDEIG